MTTDILVRAAAAVCCGGIMFAAQPIRPEVPLDVAVVLAPGDAALRGVELGAGEAGRTASLLGQHFAVHVAAAAGKSVADSARALIARHGAAVLIGGSDDQAASALADAAAELGVIFLNVGAHADSLRSGCAMNAVHVIPSAAMLRAARTAVAGDSAAAWHDSLERFGAGQVNDRFRAERPAPVGEREWTGWMAVKIAWEAAQRAPSLSAHDLAGYLRDASTVFDGHKGLPLSFRADGQLRQPVYVLNGGSVSAEVPTPRDDPDMDAAALLDRLFPGETGCERR